MHNSHIDIITVAGIYRMFGASDDPLRKLHFPLEIQVDSDSPFCKITTLQDLQQMLHESEFEWLTAKGMLSNVTDLQGNVVGIGDTIIGCSFLNLDGETEYRWIKQECSGDLLRILRDVLFLHSVIQLGDSTPMDRDRDRDRGRLSVVTDISTADISTTKKVRDLKIAL